jgi:gliding motility-associated-like protein
VFEVAVTGPTGCAWADEVLVAVSPMNGGSVDATADPAIVDPGGTTVQLQAIPGSGVSYSWSPPDAVSDPTIASPTAFVTQSTTFYVVVSDGVCSRMDSVRVEVYELRCEEPDIFIPDAFTPNGDGNNDVLFVRGRHIRDLELKVFDRWGEVVFATTDQAKGWDATYKGRPVDPAVYVYWLTAHCIDGQEFFKKGNVTVIR